MPVIGRMGARRENSSSEAGLKRWAMQAGQNQQPAVSTLLVGDMDEVFEVWNTKDCIMEGYVEKRGIGADVVWFQRRAMFDREKFSLAKVDSTRVLDFILLKDIIKVKKIENMMSEQPSDLLANTARRASLVLPQGALAALAPQTPGRNSGGRDIRSTSVFSNHNSGLNIDTDFDSSKSAFEIQTSFDSRHVGTTYVFRAGTEVECSEWVDNMSKAVRVVRNRLDKERRGTFNEKARKFLGPVHESNVFQLFVVVLISANFLINLGEAQFLPPPGSSEERIYSLLDLVFTVVFAVELLLNIYVNWWRAFLSSGWSVFDLVVVSTSLLAAVLPQIPAVNVLRLVRIFRIFRLFQWFRSLKIIINAVTAAILPVFSSFIVLFLVTCIYAMMAHNLFHERFPERFGNFSSSLFTMFQVCTGDGWAEAVVRPMFPGFDDDKYSEDLERARQDPTFRAKVPGIDGPVALFFVSFVLIVGITLLNIVVAVLLDEFITSVSSEKAEMDRLRAEKKLSTIHRMQATLDPILVTLANYNNLEDLNDRIERLYQAINEDDVPAGLGFSDLHNGLKKLSTSTPINFEQEDWEIVTENYELCNDQEKLDESGFKIMLKRQLKLFVQRQMVNAMAQSEVNDPHRAAIFFVLKQLTVSFDEVAGCVMSLVDDSYEPLRGADGFIRTPSEFSHPDKIHHRDRHADTAPRRDSITNTRRDSITNTRRDSPNSLSHRTPAPVVTMSSGPRFLGDVGKSDSVSSDPRRAVHQPNLSRESSFAHRHPSASFSARDRTLAELQQSISDVSAKLDLRLDDVCRRIDAVPLHVHKTSPVNSNTLASERECTRCGPRPAPADAAPHDPGRDPFPSSSGHRADVGERDDHQDGRDVSYHHRENLNGHSSSSFRGLARDTNRHWPPSIRVDEVAARTLSAISEAGGDITRQTSAETNLNANASPTPSLSPRGRGFGRKASSHSARSEPTAGKRRTVANAIVNANVDGVTGGDVERLGRAASAKSASLPSTTLSPSVAHARAHQFLRVAWEDADNQTLLSPAPSPASTSAAEQAACVGCSECRLGCKGVGALLYDDHGVILVVPDQVHAQELRADVSGQWQPDLAAEGGERARDGRARQDSEVWVAAQLAALLKAYGVRSREAGAGERFDVPYGDARHVYKCCSVKVSSKHLPVAPAQLEPSAAGLALSSQQTSTPAILDALTRRVLSQTLRLRLAHARSHYAPLPPDLAPAVGSAPTFFFAQASSPDRLPVRSGSGTGRPGSRERGSDAGSRRPVQLVMMMESGRGAPAGKRRPGSPASRRTDDRPVSLGQEENRDLMEAISRRMGQQSSSAPGGEGGGLPERRVRSMHALQAEEGVGGGGRRWEPAQAGGKRASMQRVSLQAHFSAAAAQRGNGTRDGHGEERDRESEEPRYEQPQQRLGEGAARQRRGSTASRDGREMAALLRHSRQNNAGGGLRQRPQTERAATSLVSGEGADRSADPIQSGVWPANVRASSDALESLLENLL